MGGGGMEIKDHHETTEEVMEEVDEVMMMNGLKGRPPRKTSTAANTNGNGSSSLVNDRQVVTVLPGEEEEEEEEEEKVEEEESTGKVDDEIAVAVDDVPNSGTTTSNQQEQGGGGEEESQASSTNSVYLDKADQGTWKCRHCIWTYRMESFGIDPIQKPKGHCHGPMNIQTLTQQGPSFGLQVKGAGSTSGTSGIKFLAADCSTAEKAPSIDELVFEVKDTETSLANGTNHQEKLKDVGQTGLQLLFSENLLENGNAGFRPVSKHVNIGIVKESKQEVADWDIERVIEEQDTHDMYCPNCNSCITKRVILRKRKRTVPNIGNGKNRERPETPVQSKSDADHSAGASYGGDHSTVESGSSVSPDALGTNDRDSDTGPDIFRCLSCFSFFIPTVAGFKRIFGVKDEGASTHSPQQTPPTSIATGQQGDDANNAIHVSSERDDQVSSLQGVSLPNNSLLKSEDHVNGAVSPNQGTHVLEEAKVGEATPDGSNTKNADEKNGSSSTLSSTYPFIEQFHVPNQVKVTMGKHTEDGRNDLVLTIQGAALPLETDPKYKNEDAGKKIDRGDDVILLLREDPVAGALPVIPPVSEIEPSIGEQGVVTARRSSEWDILKSIVYGGLVEVITSLGVVSSAAGGEVKTLNIVALGVANLVSGLLFIINALWELKKEQYGRISDVEEEEEEEEERVDRYEQVLGWRNNFRRHVIFALLSYLVFGVLPPITYGFSFRKSDNKEYKLIAVAAVSLVCIVLLAIGKAHTKKPPTSYIKTILFFVSMGVMASGLSYVAGELIKELLEKLALFEPSAVAPLPPSSTFLQTIPSSSAKPAAWVSY